MQRRKRNWSRTFALMSALIVLATTGPGCVFHWGKGIQGSGDLETRTLDVKNFESVELQGAFDVDIRAGQDQMLRVTIDDNLWDNLVSEVDRGSLELGWEESCRPDRNCRIEITVPELVAFQLQGAGDVTIQGLDGDSFVFSLSGAGDVELAGQVENLKVRLSGAGDIEARDLKADRVDVQLSGAGNATVFANKSIEGRVSGVGNLTYYGDPEDRDTHVSGLGHITRK